MNKAITKSQVAQVQLRPEEMKYLKQQAKNEERSVSWIVRDLILKDMDSEKDRIQEQEEYEKEVRGGN